MTPLLLALLAVSPYTACDPTVQPTPCERALAEQVLVERDVCKAKLKVKDDELREVKELMLEPPPPPEPSLSLLGMPGWVTPAIASILFVGGIAVGVAL